MLKAFGADVTADCGPERFIVKAPGERFECLVSFPGGETTASPVIVGDEGQFRIPFDPLPRPD